MHTMAHDIATPVQDRGEESARTVIYTTLYDLIAAVHDTLEPGEEHCVTPVVAHLLHAGQARFLTEVRAERAWADAAPLSLLAQARSEYLEISKPESFLL
ncbi:MAG: hypothetical protein AB7N91_18210 [Candidatus Tectimicrobiota bacterium]